MIDNVLCTAPLTSVLIDTNKGVRPCCYYDTRDAGFLGNLKENKIIDIFSNDEYKKLKQQMYNKEWATGCMSCKELEMEAGSSLRKDFYNNESTDLQGWEQEKLTYLEFNGSNICNLSCLHCHPGFSSRWVIEREKIIKLADKRGPEQRKLVESFRSIHKFTDDTKITSTKMHLPNPNLVIESLKTVQLFDLKTLSFKGGEPMLNSETMAIMEYLEERDYLKNVNLNIVTNGTYINDEILKLFSKSKSVIYQVSVDGIGELFNYIRYGDAKFSELEKNIALVNELPNARINISSASMNYNAFNLLDIKDWVNKLNVKYSKVCTSGCFSMVVQSPEYLSMTTLSDATRKKLIDFYSRYNKNNELDLVINKLSNSYAGNELHNKWVDYTRTMEELRGNNILDIVPQLESELQYV